MVFVYLQNLCQSISASREYKILWLRHGLHAGGIQIATIRNTWIQFGERTTRQHGLPKRNPAVRVRSVVSGPWSLVWRHVRKSAESRCVRQYSYLRARIRVFETVSCLKLFGELTYWKTNFPKYIVPKSMRFIRINSCSLTNHVFTYWTRCSIFRKRICWRVWLTFSPMRQNIHVKRLAFVAEICSCRSDRFSKTYAALWTMYTFMAIWRPERPM